MPRIAWYAGTSTALAAAVVASAFYQRANFYSAMVHLAQSSLSLMVLVNLVFVVYGSFMYGLQRLCFGPLRPTEIEQLYEKAWFAVTETCLAMTIFRDEVGAFFLVMFTALVTGKVWGWIGEGRVEVLEQQPPANPRLFHARLGISLFVSIAYDVWLLSYAANTVVQQARPTMMLMFLFEFAVLLVCSLHTATRYIISLVEQHVVKTQTRQRLEDRRRRIREQRAEILRRRETEGAEAENGEELPDENDVEEMDIEVPGWETKGQWVLSLDLLADFIKLGIYSAFFCVLLTFYGLPIHIMRDWFMTTRSFLKRLHALIRYRQALKHMDQYPDATAEDLGREDTCIICREEMRPWDAADSSQVERSRAKKLPCGHILHFGCLKSWLERQQVCPTCRRPVAREGQQQAANNGAVVFRLGLNFPAGQNQQAPPPANGQGLRGGEAGPGVAGANQGDNQNNRDIRMFNLGPLRLGFARGGADEIQEMAQRLRLPGEAANPPAPTPTVPAPAPQEVGGDTNANNNDAALDLDHIRAQLLTFGQQLRQEVLNVHNAAHEVHVLSLLVNELARLRQQQQQPRGQQQTVQQAPQQIAMHQAAPGANPGAGQVPPQMHFAPPSTVIHPMFQHAQPPIPHAPHQMPPRSVPAVTRHVGAGYGAAIPAGSPELPEGVVIPPGWSLLPLQRLEGEAAPPPPDPLTQFAQGAAQDMLRSVLSQMPHPQQHQQRSRGTSPAPAAAAGLAAQPARSGAAAPGSSSASVPTTATTTAAAGTGTATAPAAETNPPEPSRIVRIYQNNNNNPSTTAAASTDTSDRSRQMPVTTVTAAPVPLAPNWGGQAQLFGGGGGGGERTQVQAPFGYQVGEQQNNHQESNGATAGPAVARATTTTTVVNGVSAGAGAGERRSSGGSVGGGTGGGIQGGEGRENGSAGGRGPRAVTVEEADESEENDEDDDEGGSGST